MSRVERSKLNFTESSNPNFLLPRSAISTAQGVSAQINDAERKGEKGKKMKRSLILRIRILIFYLHDQDPMIQRAPTQFNGAERKENGRHWKAERQKFWS